SYLVSTLSLHDALPIFSLCREPGCIPHRQRTHHPYGRIDSGMDDITKLPKRAAVWVETLKTGMWTVPLGMVVLAIVLYAGAMRRSEEHTSELQSRANVV